MIATTIIALVPLTMVGKYYVWVVLKWIQILAVRVSSELNTASELNGRSRQDKRVHLQVYPALQKRGLSNHERPMLGEDYNILQCKPLCV